MGELIGMAAICDKVKRSESTVWNWIRDMDFPAKNVGGIWESNDDLIQTWKKKFMDEKISKPKDKKKVRRFTNRW